LHVLLTEDRAEHVPGCNMAVRRTALAEIGGFHKPLMAAGDDGDVCWRLLDRGHQIAFAPAAQGRHPTRPTLPACLRPQRTDSAGTPPPTAWSAAATRTASTASARAAGPASSMAFPAFFLDCCDQSSTKARSAARHTRACCADRPKV